MAWPLFIAHRGGSAEAPENTLAAFRHALALGVDGIELDVRVTRDGMPMVYHDPALDRLAGRRDRLVRLTREELRAARIDGEPIPTLAEALAFIGRRAIVQIEIKRGVPVAPVVAAVQEACAEKTVVFASFEPKLVADARRLAPRIPRMLIATGRGRVPLARGRAAGLPPLLAELGAAGVSMDYRAIGSATFVATLKKRGLSVWCWTVNQPNAMLRLARWGVDAILSDRPALFRSIFTDPGF